VALAIAAAALGGLLVGSLLDVVAQRLPRGESLATGEPIRGRDAIAAATTAVLFAAVVVVAYDEASRLVLGLVLVAVLVPLALIDLQTRLLPNVLTLPAAVLAVTLGVALDPAGEVERLIAGALTGSFFLLAALLQPAGMGMGDVKLAAVLGLFLGREVAVAVLVALVCGVAVGAVIIARKGYAAGRGTAIPFGPFLALGGVVAVLAGDVLVDAYGSTL
jgi:leader peptidase (prepilin peptidase) / N-methyltransferase